MRLPELVLGDLDAQYATCTIGERELLRAASSATATELEAYFDRLIDYGEALTRKAIAAWPDGDYALHRLHRRRRLLARRRSRSPAASRWRATISRVDFAGSSPQVKGAINSTFSFVKSATYLTIRCALDHEVPNNAGVYRCITRHARRRARSSTRGCRRRWRRGR